MAKLFFKLHGSLSIIGWLMSGGLVAYASPPSIGSMQPRGSKVDNIRFSPSKYTEEKSVPSKREITLKNNLPSLSEAPEGVLSQYQRYSHYFMPSYGEIYDVEDYGTAVDVITDSDGHTIYMNYPVSGIEANYWIKGTKTDTGFSFILPQPIYAAEAYDENGQPNGEISYILSAMMLKKVESTDGEMVTISYLPDDNQELRYIIDGNILYTETEGDERIIGVVNENNEWNGYGDIFMALEEFNLSEVIPPTEIEIKPWSHIYGNTGHFVNVGIDNTDIYVQGLFTSFPEKWIKGTINGNKILFNSGQYLGLDWSWMWEPPHRGVFYGCDFVLNDIDPDWSYYEPFLTDSIELSFDTEKLIIFGSENDGLALNSGYYQPTQTSLLFTYRQPWIGYQPEADKPIKPANPVISSFYPYDELYGSAIFNFDLFQISEGGILLHQENLYYNIFLDDELFVFEPDEYPYLSEPMVNVPFTFCSPSYDIYASDLTSLHQVYFYFDGAETIGVQLCNKVGDIVTKSDIVSYSTSGILSNKSDEPIYEKWLDLNGLPSTSTAKGIKVKISTFTDGETLIEKIITR